MDWRSRYLTRRYLTTGAVQEARGAFSGPMNRAVAAACGQRVSSFAPKSAKREERRDSPNLNPMGWTLCCSLGQLSRREE